MTSLLLLVIGFGMLVIGIRLMMLRNGLRRAGKVPITLANQALKEGLIIFVIGLIALLVGIFWAKSSILIGTGVSLLYVALLSAIQGTIQRGLGTERQLCIGSWVVSAIGFALIIAYVFTQLC